MISSARTCLQLELEFKHRDLQQKLETFFPIWVGFTRMLFVLILVNDLSLYFVQLSLLVESSNGNVDLIKGKHAPIFSPFCKT